MCTFLHHGYRWKKFLSKNYPAFGPIFGFSKGNTMGKSKFIVLNYFEKKNLKDHWIFLSHLLICGKIVLFLTVANNIFIMSARRSSRDIQDGSKRPRFYYSIGDIPSRVKLSSCRSHTTLLIKVVEWLRENAVGGWDQVLS